MAYLQDNLLYGDAIKAATSKTAASTPAPEGFSISKIIEDNAPLISSLGTLGGNYLNNRQIEQDTNSYNRQLQESANTVSQAYDDQLGQREQGYDVLRGYAGGRLNDVSAINNQAVQDYSRNLTDNVGDYSVRVMPAYNRYADTIEKGVDQYGNAMYGVGSNVEGVLTGAESQVNQMYDPYVSSGLEAQQMAVQLMGLDPSQLTPSQQIIRERLIRDSNANMMASGLRGAGRAGLAAQNEAIATQDAQFHDENQRRKDAAMSSLMNTGFNATGQVASNVGNTARQVGNMRLGIGEDVAKTGLRSTENIAQGRQQQEETIADRYFGAGQDSAKTKLQGQETNMNLASDYYKNLSDIEGGRFSDRGSAAFGKGITQASTKVQTAANTNSANAAQRSGTNQAFATIGNALGDWAKKEWAGKGNSNTVNGKV